MTFQELNSICLAYMTVVRDFYSGWGRVKPPNPGSRTYENCREVWELCERLRVSLGSYMFTAIDFYSRGWLLKTFNRSYPPFRLIVSEKPRHCVELILKEPLKPKDIEIVGRSYLKMLKGLKLDRALFAVEQGLCGESETLKKFLREGLKGAC